MMLLQDSAAILGIVIAASGIFAADRWGHTELDGVASILISLVWGVTAFILARRNKALLIGERAGQRIHESMLEAARSECGVRGANSS